MPSPLPLHELLRTQATAPADAFDRIAVGELQRQAAMLQRLVDDMLSEAPSRLQVVLGPNGNGKTLLQRALQHYATNINIKVDPEAKKVTRRDFQILFSRVSLQDTEPSLAGVELAKNLQRSLRENAATTYSSIATAILADFTSNFKPSVLVRASGAIPRYFLTKAIQKYQTVLDGVITTDEVDPVVEGLDRAQKGIQRWMAARSMRHAFGQYLQRQNISGYIRPFVEGDEVSAQSIPELNRSLYNTLQTSRGASSILEVARDLARIARGVHTKLLILMIDDANDIGVSRLLLPLANNIGEFVEPKLLVLVSALQGPWNDAMHALHPQDMSAVQKLDTFGDKLLVKPPTRDELSEMTMKLTALINSELRVNYQFVQLGDADRELLANQSEGLSFREATKKIVTFLLAHLAAV